MTSEQYQGKVKQYNPEKGFGFISSPEGEVFFISRISPPIQVSRNAMTG